LNSSLGPTLAPVLAAGPAPARIAGMNRKRGRRSTRRDMAELQAEIRASIVKWDALSPEEKMRAGSRDMHSTPDFRREPTPGGPFAAWAEIRR
jgi:hypothetical protein